MQGRKVMRRPNARRSKEGGVRTSGVFDAMDVLQYHWYVGGFGCYVYNKGFFYGT